MRRRLIIGFACLVPVGAVAPPAGAKGRVELRSPPPAGLRAGAPWHAHLFVHATARELAAANPPEITIHSDEDGWTTFRPARVRGHPGAYTAAVVFPAGGAWTYHVHDPIAGGGYDFDPVMVAAQAESGGGLAVPLLVGVLLIAAAAIVIRLRRA